MILNLNYAIFRSEPINTLGDLVQIGSHNKREKQSHKSNSNIDKSKSVVAHKLLFTATNIFFKDMNKDDIKDWTVKLGIGAYDNR